MATSKKTAPAKRKTTEKKPAASKKKRTSATAKRRSSGTAAKRKQSAFWNHTAAGILLLVLSLILLLALFRFDGILLGGILRLSGGLIGWGTRILWIALGFAGILCMCNWQPVRLRAVCILLVPVLYSVLAQCILLQPMPVSMRTVVQLWQDGQALRSGGVIGGTAAVILSVLLSSAGTEILITLLMIAVLFVIFNTTPVRLYRKIVQIVAEDTEYLHEKEKPEKKRGSVFAYLRRQGEKRRAGQQEEPEQPEQPAEPEKPALPEPDVEVTVPLWEDETPPWLDEPELPPEPPKKKQKKQPEEEIVPVMDTPMAEYSYPSADLLQTAPRSSGSGIRTELKESSERLVDTLKSFGIEVQIINIIRGPSVTRFEIQMERGIKFSRITALSDDIALALGADSVRIAPIPDKVAIGIEVPNKHIQMVALRDVITSKSFEQADADLAVALGKDITGTAQITDLSKMPHLLIAGTTGSGKSVCINSILISLLYKSSPKDVRLIMIDPKMVELGNYNGIPHLLIPVVTDPKKASGALSWAVGEMERRYAVFAAAGVRDLSDYNRHASMKHSQFEPMPKIVIVIDELADLMMVVGKEVETSICRIAQKARAAGMHLVVATQRPSTDVITGLMKSNIPSRIAFAVASQVESRIILDTPGAEKLIGKGDMLYAPLGMNKPLRIQGCFVSSEEIERVIAHVKTTAAVEYSQEVMEEIERHAEAEDSASGYRPAEDEDELMPQAITIVVESGQASVSMLQRRLKLGYARAARLMDQMEQRGIVGEFEGSKPRQVLISKEEWMQIQLRQKL